MTNLSPIEPSVAVAAFMARIITHAYQGAINTVVGLLEKGPPGRLKPANELRLHNWYLSLNPDDQSMVRAIIAESARASVFGFLVVLDNKTIGYPVPGQASDFAVNLQTYLSEDARNHYMPAAATRINRSYEPGGDLHDLLNDVVAGSPSQAADQ